MTVHHPSDRPSVRTTGILMLNNSFNMCTEMATQMQLEVILAGKRESRRQSSGEAHREKGRQRSWARDKKQRRHFFVGGTTCCSGGDNANGHQCKEKMGSSEKKVNKNTYDIASIKKFLEVSRCSRAKQRQRNVQKQCAARAKLLFS